MRSLRTWLGIAWLAAGHCAVAAPSSGNWNFEVLLDGKPIGEHRFAVSTADGQATVRSRARFDVKVLFIPAYRYRHEADETSRGGCLVRLQSRTDDNGEDLSVTADGGPAGLKVRSSKGDATLDGCVMGFAYWDVAMLDRRRLLNAQTGEYQQVTIEPLPPQMLTVRGEAVQARRYRLTGPENPLELWYSASGEWLALESTVAGGRKLRYRLMP